MRSGTRLLTLIAATIGLGMGAAGSAAAGGIVLTTPPGLVPGDTFRVVFLTDGTTLATSSNIDYYNTFVNTQAGSVTYDGQAVTFTAIGSTSTVNAIDNIPGSSSAPVYLVNGTEVASSTTTATGGLWSGTIMSPIDLDLAGKTGPLVPVWTGTQASGIGSPDVPLGGTNTSLGLAVSVVGDPASVNSTWVDLIDGPNAVNSSPMYGISEVLTVAQSVPEPSSAVLIVTGLGVGLAVAWARRRAQRRQRPMVAKPASVSDQPAAGQP